MIIVSSYEKKIKKIFFWFFYSELGGLKQKSTEIVSKIGRIQDHDRLLFSLNIKIEHRRVRLILKMSEYISFTFLI